MSLRSSSGILDQIKRLFGKLITEDERRCLNFGALGSDNDDVPIIDGSFVHTVRLDNATS
ncbi:MAG: hypothetical protein Q7T82_10425 [Armatimonadota bacterium]|nr:hypothetical protein [Armatimonadota bacterium]